MACSRQGFPLCFYRCRLCFEVTFADGNRDAVVLTEYVSCRWNAVTSHLYECVLYYLVVLTLTL